MNQDDRFELYNLELVVDRIEGDCTCSMTVGDKVRFEGGKFSLPENADFCMYALQSALPLIPAKQRQNHPNDWMETDSEIACPDPACGLVMSIHRTETQEFHHDDVSANKIREN